MNPFRWFRAHLRRKARARFIAELSEKWRKQVWDWHVPLQKESIAARGPIMRICEEERGKIEAGMPLDKQRLQQAFAVLFEEMVLFDDRIIEEFVEWYHSEAGATWRSLLEREELDELFLANAGEILRRTARTTLNVCQYNARDLIEAEELYALCATDA